MKTLNPIFFREIYTLPRQKYFYIKRMLVIVFPLILWLDTIDSGSSAQGLASFQIFAYFSLFALVFLAIVSALPLIIKEKESNRLLLLLLTRMSPSKIVLGKFLSCFFFMSLIYSAFLPFALLSLSLGGISIPQIEAIFFLTLGALTFSIALAMFLAMLFSERAAFLGTITVILLCFIAPYISPLRAIEVCLEKGLTDSCYRVFLFEVASALFLLWGTSYSLVKEGQKDSHSSSGANWTKKWTKREKNSPLLGESNPIFWRDYHKVHGGQKQKWHFCFLLTILFGFFCIENTEYLFFLPVVLFTIPAILIFYQCLNAFLREQKGKTWELLLLTNLSEKEIYKGKVKAIWKSNLPFIWIGHLSLLLGIPIFWLGDIFAFYLATVVYYGLLVLVYSLALYLSLHCRSLAKAFIQLLVILGLIHLINSFLLFFFFGVLGTLAFLILPIIYMAIVFRYYGPNSPLGYTSIFFLCFFCVYLSPFLIHIFLPIIISKQTQKDIQNYFSLEPFTWKRIFWKNPLVKNNSFTRRRRNY